MNDEVTDNVKPKTRMDLTVSKFYLNVKITIQIT